MAGNKMDFIKRYKELVEKVERGEISIGDACYEIAGGMERRALREDAVLEKIMEEAGEVRILSRGKGGNVNDRWVKLRSRIESL